MIPQASAWPPPDDAELARRLTQGDQSAFEPLMRRHNQMLYRLARSILKDEAEAESAKCPWILGVVRLTFLSFRVAPAAPPAAPGAGR